MTAGCLCAGAWSQQPVPAASARVQPARAAERAGSPAGPERLAWTFLRGPAADLSVGLDGTAFAVDLDGRVWRRAPGPDTPWSRLPGAFIRIDAASERLAVAVAADGGTYRWDGTAWRPLPAPPAQDAAIAPAGQVAVAARDGRLLVLQPEGHFAPVGRLSRPVVRVDLDEAGRPWVVLRDGALARFDGQSWDDVPGRARDVSAGQRGVAFMVDEASGAPARWNPAVRGWTPLLARAQVVAASPSNRPWVVTPEGLVFSNDMGTVAVGRPAAAVSPFIQAYAWQPVAGTAASLSISARGHVMALGPAGEVWSWRGANQWQRLPGAFRRIAVGPSGQAIAVAPDGALFTLQGQQWSPLPGRALDVAITPQGVPWILLPDGSPAYFGAQRQWVSLGAPGDAVRLAVGPSDRPWVIGRDGQVRSHDGSAWLDHPGVVARDLAIGPEGTVFAVDADGRLVRWNALGRQWDRVNAEAVAVAVGPGEKPWVALASGAIRASSLFEEPPTLGGAECSAAVGGNPVAFEPLEFVRVRGPVAAQDLAIGKDGSVFALDTDGGMLQWRNRTEEFRAFPGRFTRIAVAPNGQPWGVTPLGEVWRHDGSRWLQTRSVNLSAREIAIGCNGTVFVTDRQEALWRYVPRMDGFQKLLPVRRDEAAPTGGKVAVDPRGHPWVIRGDWVWRCDESFCERQGIRARDIAIGPEGTLMVVDLDGQLQAYDARAAGWRRLNLTADAVAVGPGGRPWVLRNGNEVWRTALFPRDEEEDTRRAAATPVQAANTDAPPPFTFSITIPFDPVPLPAGFVPFAGPGTEVHLAFAPGAKLVVKDAAYQFWAYDEARKQFTRDTTVPSPQTPAVLNGDPMRALFIGADGTSWITSAGIAPKIWRRAPTGSWQSVALPADCPSTAGCGFPSPVGVNVAPDGGVFATSEGNNLYRYDPQQQRFLPYTAVPRPPGGAGFIAFDGSGHPWVASPGALSLFEWVGGAWARRTDAVIGNPSQCFFTATPCVSFAGTGTGFGLGAVGQLVRWNPAARLWERVTSSPDLSSGTYVGAPDGRPWVWTGPGGTPANTLLRAR